MTEYIDNGSIHDTDIHAHSYLINPLIDLLDQREKRVILDLGCGKGVLTRRLLQEGYNVYGTDASKKRIELAQSFYPERFAIQDLEINELPDELDKIPFNTIMSTEVIEHLYHPRKFIQFIKEILEQNGGGDLIISTPYHGYLKNLTISLSGKWDRHMNPLWDGGHIKMWSRKTLTRLLEEEGFQITDFKGCGRLPYLWKSMIIKARITHEI